MKNTLSYLLYLLFYKQYVIYCDPGFEYGRSDYGFGAGGGMYGGFDPMRGPMGGGMSDAGMGPKSAEKKVRRASAISSANISD
jgi:hypothetical protein